MTRDSIHKRRTGDRSISSERTVSDSDLVRFSDLAGDSNPIHSDPEFAERSDYGGLIAPGLLTLSLGLGLLFGDQIASSHSETLTVVGIDRVRFIRPVKPGDSIHVASEIVDVRGMETDRELIEFRFQIRNQHGTDVATGRCKLLAQSFTESKDDS